MLLSIRNLSVAFPTLQGHFPAIDDLCLEISSDDSLAIIGESGCGKSVLAYAILRLLDDIANVEGCVLLNGVDLNSLDGKMLQTIRGNIISLIPQSPSLAFNPVRSIGKQIVDSIKKNRDIKTADARAQAMDALVQVGFTDIDTIYQAYPHRLSGGMCEMALIALALSLKPALIIADEPTKGLDPFSRNKVVSALHTTASKTAMIMITHDLVAASSCSRIAVMYAGEIVEEGKTCKVFKTPQHYYTQGLMSAIPANGMQPIPGFDTQSNGRGSGCRFKNRCHAKENRCNHHPSLVQVADKWKVRCHLA
jgi:peptide/nickel transport system ATP-binding protein